MQDLDFGKYRFHAKSKIRGISAPYEGRYGKKLFILVITFIFAFTLGTFGGMYISHNKIEETDLLLHDPKDNLNERDELKKQVESKSQANEKLISKNIPPTNKNNYVNISKDRGNPPALKNKLAQINGKKTYLIWAKTYQSNVTAYRHGHFLKKQNLPVFLAKSGTQMKLYIGPIHGKTKAYQVLSKVKKWVPFKAAVLHEKTD